jgi:hypothetical protein
MVHIWLFTFTEYAVDYSLHCRTNESLVLLSGFCLYQCPSYISCITLSPFLHYLFLQTPPNLLPIHCLFRLHISQPTIPISPCIFFKYNPFVGHMPLFLYETPFLIPIFGSILVDLFFFYQFISQTFCSFESQILLNIKQKNAPCENFLHLRLTVWQR